MLKRAFDLLIATILAVVLIVPFLGLILLVRVWLGSPVLFIQERPGLRGRPFRMYKLRTMSDARDSAGRLLPDRDRLKPFGAFLRSTSLDELPGLVNVIKGEMSLVGPRPLLMEYVPLYSANQARRHDVKPGITGWAQIHGRNTLSWDDRFKLDVQYVDHRSMWLDLKILAITVARVVNRDGISQAGEATAVRFSGTENRLS